MTIWWSAPAWSTELMLGGWCPNCVSTTHAITTSIMGVGLATCPGAWDTTLVERILWAWVFAIPATVLLAYRFFGLLHLFIAARFAGRQIEEKLRQMQEFAVALRKNLARGHFLEPDGSARFTALARFSFLTELIPVAVYTICRSLGS